MSFNSEHGGLFTKTKPRIMFWVYMSFLTIALFFFSSEIIMKTISKLDFSLENASSSYVSLQSEQICLEYIIYIVLNQHIFENSLLTSHWNALSHAV